MRRLSLLAATALFSTCSVTAAGLQWDIAPGTSGAQGGTGTWNAANTNWWNGAADVAWDGADATFGAASPAGSYTVTVGGAISTTGLSYTGTANTVTIVAGTTASDTLALSGNVDVASGGSLTVRASTAGSVTGSLNKTGAGTLTLDTSNNMGGLTNVTLTAGSLLFFQNNPSSAFTLTLNGGSIGSGSTSARTFANATTIGGDIAIGNSAAVTFSGTVNLNAGTRAINVSSSGATISGVISNGGLTKTGTGVLTISNANNTYTGATAVNAGTLNLTGKLTSAVSVASGATISGTGTTTGSLTLNGGNALVLAGGAATTGLTVNGATIAAATTFSFAAATNSGTTYDVLTYGAGGLTGAGNLGVLGHGTLNTAAAGGTKVTFLSAGAQTRTWNTGTGTWAQGSASGTNFAEGDQVFYTGDSAVFNEPVSASVITLAGTLAPGSVTVGNTTNTYTFTSSSGNVIGGAATLTKNGAGTLILNGSAIHAYTGATTVNGGVLELAVTGIGFSSTTGSSGGGGLAVNAGGTVNVTGSYNIGYSRAVTLNGGTMNVSSDNYANNLTLQNGATLNGNSTSLRMGYHSDGTMTVSGTTASFVTGTLNLVKNGTTGDEITFNVGDVTSSAATDLTISAAVKDLSGNAGAAFIKTGAGKLLLSGANTYVGGTTVSAGVLATNHVSALGAGNVNVGAAGAVLQIGDGTANAVTLAANATLAIANGATLRLGGLNAGSLDAAAGVITLSGTGTYAFNATGALDLNGMLNGLAAGNHTYTLISGGSAASDLQLANISGYNSTVTNLAYNAGILSFTSVVPEPSTYGLLGAGALGVVALVRRRKRDARS